MDYRAVAALTIFTVTLYLMVRRPHRINLGLASGVGAALSLLAGTVTLSDAAAAFIEILDAAFAFTGIVAFSLMLDSLGFFRWAALKVIRSADGDGLKLYFYISLLTASVSVLFANDSTILILTPIVIEIINELKMEPRERLAYLFAAGLITDTAAMPLITSNPVNIVSADFFGYSFIDHAIFMGPIAMVTITTSLLILYAFFRRSIPRWYSMEAINSLDSEERIIHPSILKICISTLIAVDIGYIVASFNRIPVSIVICSGALFLLLAYIVSSSIPTESSGSYRSLTDIVRKINWDIVIFMVSIFVVVQGLKHMGAIEFFTYVFLGSLKLPYFLSVLSASMIVTVGASIMNNWPMTILGLLSIREAMRYGLDSHHIASLIFSNIIGNNLGPHFFPLGSLAIIMWIETMRRKGVGITLRDYLKVGSVISIVEVTISSIILWIEINTLNIKLNIPLEHLKC
ncbi:MAG: ArsB/NhaD family transporter [Candidatus Bathyarchaeia archaeon]